MLLSLGRDSLTDLANYVTYDSLHQKTGLFKVL